MRKRAPTTLIALILSTPFLEAADPEPMVPTAIEDLARSTCPDSHGRPTSVVARKYSFDPTPAWGKDYQSLVFALEIEEATGATKARVWQDYEVLREFQNPSPFWASALSCDKENGFAFLAVLLTAAERVHLTLFKVNLDDRVETLLPTPDLYARRPLHWDQRPKPTAQLDREVSIQSCEVQTIKAALEGSLVRIKAGAKGACLDAYSLSFDLRSLKFSEIPKEWYRPPSPPTIPWPLPPK